MKQLNSHMFEEAYEKLGIDLDSLGCIMLNLGAIKNKYVDEKDLYYSDDPKQFWINGWVAGSAPHITLLYGLLKSGITYQPHVESVLDGWDIKEIEIEKVGFFDSPYEGRPYYCIVAHIKPTPELIEGHERLEFLPHINTFTGYKPHFTLTYIRKDEKLRDEVVELLNNQLKGTKLSVKTGVDLGK